MLMDPMGGIVMTNDGNAILREVGIILFFLSFKFNIHLHVIQCTSIFMCRFCPLTNIMMQIETELIRLKTFASIVHAYARLQKEYFTVHVLVNTPFR